MRAGVMSAGLFSIPGRARLAAKERECQEKSLSSTAEWSEEVFARQQIRGLVRQLFGSAVIPEVRQVVFSAVDQETDVNELCWRVGATLAVENGSEVVVITDQHHGERGVLNCATSLRDHAVRVQRDLWSLEVPPPDRAGFGDLRNFMQRVRQEFPYSVVAAGSTATTDERRLAEFADGMVLVISALRTRRATARKLLEDLSHVRLLGTVFQDREFPIPEGIYRRL